MYSRILVPLDGSETAEKVLPFVEGEAQCHGAVVVLLRVIVPFRSSLMLVPSLLEQANEYATRAAQDYLRKVADDLRSKGLVVETEIERGPPAQRIVEAAQSGECDLIVIGSRGETGALGWRLGGVAYKVVKAGISIPVLIIAT